MQLLKSVAESAEAVINFSMFSYSFFFMCCRLELNRNTARDGADRRVGSVVGRTRERVAGIETVAVGPVEHIVACQVDAQRVYAELRGPLVREGVTYLDVLDVQVAGIRQEAVGNSGRVAVVVLQTRDVDSGFSGVHAFSRSLCMFIPTEVPTGEVIEPA